MKKVAIIDSVFSLADIFGVAHLWYTINKSAFTAVEHRFYDILDNFDLLTYYFKLFEEEEEEEEEEEKTD